MKLFRLVIFAILISPAAHLGAQVNPSSPVYENLLLCINEAIANGGVTKIDQIMRFDCSQDTAKSLYHQLDNKNISTDGNCSGQGDSEILCKFIKNGEINEKKSLCYRIIADASGKSTNQFGCYFYMSIGDAINY